MSTESKIILGMAGAALAGLAIGILVAPTSGEETRGKVRKGVNSLASSLLDKVRSSENTLSDTVEEVTDAAKAKFNEAKGYVRAEARHLKKDLESAAS